MGAEAELGTAGCRSDEAYRCPHFYIGNNFAVSRRMVERFPLTSTEAASAAQHAARATLFAALRGALRGGGARGGEGGGGGRAGGLVERLAAGP